MPAVRKFIQRYPEVNLEMVATADELDLAAREADVALRGTDQPPPTLVGKRIAQIGFAVYGTRALMEQATADPDAEDLACVLGEPDRRLHRIQARHVESGPALWVLSHVDLRTTARVRIFRYFLVEELEKQKDLIAGKQR